jgi:hypothetical protein
MVVPNTQEDDRSRLSAVTAFWSFFGCKVQTETGHHRFQTVSTVREGRKEGKPTDCRVGELRTADYKERSSPSRNAIALALSLPLSLSRSLLPVSLVAAAACASPSSSCSIWRESNRWSDDKVSPCFLFLFLLSSFLEVVLIRIVWRVLATCCRFLSFSFLVSWMNFFAAESL